MDVLLFGDQTDLSYHFLENSLLRSQATPIFTSFTYGAAKVLHCEIALLSQADREAIPTFTSIEELIQRSSENGPGHLAVEGALLCITQFLHFIG